MRMLDPRLQTSDEADRARRFQKEDPVGEEVFVLMSESFPCCECDRPIGVGELAWLKRFPPDSDEAQLAALDPAFTTGESVSMFCCETCARKALEPSLDDYLEERRQCAREERVEAAVLYETEKGHLTAEHWLTIAEANLGLVEPPLLPNAISKLVHDFSERFSENDPIELEKLRSRIWEFVPMKLRPDGGARLGFSPQGVPEVSIEPIEGSPTLATVSFRSVVRLEVTQ